MSESYVRFGALLKLERENRGRKLEVISSELKIPIETLQYLEAGQQDALPSELYFRLFAKSYAEYLGIDFTKTIEAIREELGELIEPQTPEQAAEPGHKTKAEPTAPITEPVEEKSSAKTGLLIALSLAVIAALAVGGYFLFFSKGSEPKAEVQTTPVQPDYSATQPDYGWDSAGPQRDSMLLTLTTRIGSWATVLADGDTMIYQMLSPGRPYNVTAHEQLLVSIGNPLVVDATLNGQPATLADPETGEVSQVEINLSTVEMFLVPTDSVDTPSNQTQGTQASGTQTPAGVTPPAPGGDTQSTTRQTGGR
jgi:hypothetical protein